MSSSSAAPHLQPAVAGLQPVQRIATLVLVLATGLCIGFGAWWISAICLVPIVLLLAHSRPEWIIVLFITAGLYKQDPRIADRVPFDLTIAFGILLAVTLVPRMRRIHVPRQSFLLLPLFVAAAWGLLAPANAYGFDKALRFCMLTALVTVASIVIVDSPKRLRRFLVALALLGFFASINALQQPQAEEWQRLTTGGSNPIPLGRIGAIAFAFAWIRFHFAKSAFERIGMIFVLGIAATCTLASGSRGPVLSILASLVLLSGVTYSAHRRMPIALGLLAVCAVLGVIFQGLATGPTVPWHRFELLFDENKGASILVRWFMFVAAWKLILANPLGIGIGGFERYAPLDLRYPHNLLLEVGCELGWVPLLTLAVFLAWGLFTMFRILRREYTWQAVFLGVVYVSALMNAMVSGDLNDNRLLNATFVLPFIYLRMQERSRPLGGDKP